MLNESHPIIPPIRAPYDQSIYSNEFEEYEDLMINLKNELALKRRLLYKNNDHKARENPLIINELLYESDHDKIIDEIKFNIS